MHVYRKEAKSLTILQNRLEKSINSLTLQSERLRDEKSIKTTIFTSFDEKKNDHNVKNEEDFVPPPDLLLFHVSPKKKESKAQIPLEYESLSRESREVRVQLSPNSYHSKQSLVNKLETNEVSSHECDVGSSSSSPHIHSHKRKSIESTEDSKLIQQKRPKFECEHSPITLSGNNLNIFQFKKPSQPFHRFSLINSSWIQKNHFSIKVSFNL
jgi:hypothetical protein